MGGLFRKIVENLLRQLIRNVLRYVAAVVEVSAGLTALDGDAAVRIRACHVCGAFHVEVLITGRLGPSRGAYHREVNRPMCR